ncbi:uncharacterized protein DUF3833 [Roseibium hamelinense]|uniref:Uncharacterized protein DUF3833 n=2 Tax=Roseibium hamelinense TaxID=150831 RepID=A0A562T738_9HYPH|nr:DUF3833 family protein [Roseibium hamelinense]TWI89357.1 uncharacterized protein DUF3833 [Roseibium hamelinense]
MKFSHLCRPALSLAFFAGVAAATFALPSTAVAKALVLEEFFKGKTVGKGVFESKIAGVNRPFTVYLTGTWNPKTFTLRLREDFVYDDGERDTKTWFFQKVAEDRYIGQRADVLGPAIVRTMDDGSLKFSYVAEVPLENGSILLRFNDTLTQIDRRTVKNTAKVVKGGFPVGTVDLTFTR